MTDTDTLVEHSDRLADKITAYKDDLDASGKVDTLAEDTGRQFKRVRTIRKVFLAGIILSLVFSAYVGYIGWRQSQIVSDLKSLVHTECVRSEKGAVLRGKLIDGLTKHVALQPGSDPQLVKTVTERNRQLDAERKDLLDIGHTIPKVKC